jgi:lysophospholipase L1-like esterase
VTRRGVAALLLGVIVVGAAAYAVAAREPSSPPALGTYLALGDSVTFGYREADALPTPNYADPASFIGFPEDVGAALGLKLTNAACRGETSRELVQTDVSSLGCPLHVKYLETQLQYAKAYLRSHHNTTLVTLMIGINDVIRCQEETSDNCASELPGILQQLSVNVETAMSEIRSLYRGPVIILNYYPLNYAGANYAPSVNRTVDKAASRYHVSVANGWNAFETAAAGSSGNICAAGLLTTLVGGGCGIHPSVAGQAVLALAVEEALRSTTPSSTAQSSSCPRGFRQGPDHTCVAG